MSASTYSREPVPTRTAIPVGGVGIDRGRLSQPRRHWWRALIGTAVVHALCLAPALLLVATSIPPDPIAEPTVQMVFAQSEASQPAADAAASAPPSPAAPEAAVPEAAPPPEPAEQPAVTQATQPPVPSPPPPQPAPPEPAPQRTPPAETAEPVRPPSLPEAAPSAAAIQPVQPPPPPVTATALPAKPLQDAESLPLPPPPPPAVPPRRRAAAPQKEVAHAPPPSPTRPTLAASRPAPATPPAPGTSAASSVPARAASAAPTSAASAAWRQALATWLSNHKTYPELARRRGIEGSLALRFSVDGAGRVLDVMVAHGSGSPILDAAAEAMLRNATLPAPPIGTQERLTVSVQLRYQLAD